MRTRRIAILIDGGFFIKRLSKLVDPQFREGVEFLLDPMWQNVNDDLHEHVDGIISAFIRPGNARNSDGEGDSDELTANPRDEPEC